MGRGDMGAEGQRVQRPKRRRAGGCVYGGGHGGPLWLKKERKRQHEGICVPCVQGRGMAREWPRGGFGTSSGRGGGHGSFAEEAVAVTVGDLLH